MTSAAMWEEKASLLGERMDKARNEMHQQAAEEADVQRRSALLAAKLRSEEQQLQEELLKKRVGSFQICIESSEGETCTAFETAVIVYLGQEMHLATSAFRV